MALNLRGRGCRAEHNYDSQTISSDGRMVTLKFYDSDYRDNYGKFYVRLVLVP